MHDSAHHTEAGHGVTLKISKEALFFFLNFFSVDICAARTTETCFSAVVETNHTYLNQGQRSMFGVGRVSTYYKYKKNISAEQHNNGLKGTDTALTYV